MKKRIPTLLIPLAVFVLGNCAKHPYTFFSFFQLRTRLILEQIVDEEIKEGLRRATRAGGDSFSVYLGRFWADRDPTPGTELNEFQNRFEARLAAGWDSLISPMSGFPDSRITPYVLYGLPTRIHVLPHSREETLVYWIYSPDFEVPESVSQYPQLKDLGLTISFVRDRLGVHTRDREGENFDPELPFLTDEEIHELSEILQNEQSDPRLCMAAAWRLRADPGHKALGALLASAGTPDEHVRAVIQAAIQPLNIVEDSSSGELVPVAASVDSSYMQQRSYYDRDLINRMRRIAILDGPTHVKPDSLYLERVRGEPYDPYGELPEDIIQTLQEAAANDENMLRGLGWLSQEEADSLFTGILGSARSLLDSEDPMAAHELLDPLLKEDLAKSAEAWHLDALSLAESNEPGGRDQAEERIRKALRLDPGNLRYQLSLAQILSRRTFDRYADQNLDRILNEVPSVADTYALKAKIRLEILWNIGWRAGGWGSSLTERTRPRQERVAEALGLLNMALVLDPDNDFATWLLGTHFMRTGRWVKVIRVMTYLIEHEAHEAEAYLGRGLAFHNLGLLEAAHQDYQAGLASLPPDIRMLADDPRWALPSSHGGLTLLNPIHPQAACSVAPDQSRTRTDQEQDEAAGSERDTFWRAKDPLFATEVNERLVEQYRRFAHVTWWFALPYLGLRGWETHRGRIYLRYGEPMTLTELTRWRLQGGRALEGLPDEFSIEGHASGGYGLVRYEYWYYDGFKIPLRVGMLTGDYLVPSPEVIEELTEVVPESPRVMGAREVVDFRHLQLGTKWYRFEDENGNLDLVLQTQFPRPEVVGPDIDELKSYAFELTLLDGGWGRIAHSNLDLPEWLFMHDRSLPLVVPAFTLPRAELLLDELYAAIELVPPGEGPAYASRDTILVPGQGVLRMSDLIAASIIVDLDEAGDLFPGTYIERASQAIVPIQDDRYHEEYPLHLYFEIYGLTLDQFNATQYQMAVEITALDEGKRSSTVVDVLGRLLGREQQEGSVRMIFEREGINSRAVEQTRVVFLSDTEATEYRVTVEVTDQVSGNVVKNSIILRSIRHPYSLLPPGFRR